MKKKNYFSDLREGLGIDEIRVEVQKVLELAQKDPDLTPLEVADALCELGIRQSSTYLPFDNETRREIQAWVNGAWQGASAELTDALATIVVNIGLPEGRVLLEAATQSEDERVRAIAQDALREFSEW
jgi:hypothetical protein